MGLFRTFKIHVCYLLHSFKWFNFLLINFFLKIIKFEILFNKFLFLKLNFKKYFFLLFPTTLFEPLICLSRLNTGPKWFLILYLKLKLLRLVAIIILKVFRFNFTFNLDIFLEFLLIIFQFHFCVSKNYFLFLIFPPMQIPNLYLPFAFQSPFRLLLFKVAKFHLKEIWFLNGNFPVTFPSLFLFLSIYLIPNQFQICFHLITFLVIQIKIRILFYFLQF